VPGVTAHFSAPVPYSALAVVAQVKHHVAILFLEDAAHQLVRVFVIVYSGAAVSGPVGTPIVFKEIEAPLL
jgi:hypothetical protein